LRYDVHNFCDALSHSQIDRPDERMPSVQFFNDGGGTNVIIHKPVSTIGTGKARYVCVRISIKNVTISAKFLASSL